MNNRFVRGRKINTRNIVIDAEVVENNNIYKNKNFNNVEKVPVGVVVIFSVVLSLISGFLGAYFVISYNADNTSFNDGIITSNLELKEASSISSAVNKVYDAVGVVEVYDKGSLISTGTGFIYKIDNNKAYLMTNNHVLSSEGDIKFLFQNARSNFEYAEDDLIDYYTYQIKAHQSKLDYLIKIAKRKGIVLSRVNELKTRLYRNNIAG